jgi:uncharacterized protein (DUF2062 family)
MTASVLRLGWRECWAALKAEHASPGRLGAAVGVGVFVAFSPFHGFQWIVAIGLSWLFRLNRLAVLVGLQASAAPVLPFVILAEVQSGELLLHRRLLPLSLSQIREANGGTVVEPLVVDLVIGSLALGLAAGTAAGLVTTGIMRVAHRA